jgi:hypothetical protein
MTLPKFHAFFFVKRFPHYVVLEDSTLWPKYASLKPISLLSKAVPSRTQSPHDHEASSAAS